MGSDAELGGFAHGLLAHRQRGHHDRADISG